MFYILFFIFLIFHQSKCIKFNSENEVKALNNEQKNKTILNEDELLIEPGISKTVFLKY